MKDLVSIFMSYPNLGKRIFYDDSIAEAIKSFGNLPDGWDYGTGVSASNKVIQEALRLLEYGRLSGYNVNARPDPDGSIILGFSIDEDFVYITVKENKLYNIAYEQGHGANYEILHEAEDVDFTYIEKILNEIQSKWYLLGPSTYYGTMIPQDDFPQIASKTWGVVYPSSTRSVPEQQVMDQFVYT